MQRDHKHGSTKVASVKVPSGSLAATVALDGSTGASSAAMAPIDRLCDTCSGSLHRDYEATCQASCPGHARGRQ